MPPAARGFLCLPCMLSDSHRHCLGGPCACACRDSDDDAALRSLRAVYQLHRPHVVWLNVADPYHPDRLRPSPTTRCEWCRGYWPCATVQHARNPERYPEPEAKP